MADTFESRHLGPRAQDLQRMLRVVGAPTLDALMGDIIPRDIRRGTPLALPEADSEFG